ARGQRRLNASIRSIAPATASAPAANDNRTKFPPFAPSKSDPGTSATPASSNNAAAHVEESAYSPSGTAPWSKTRPPPAPTGPHPGRGGPPEPTPRPRPGPATPAPAPPRAPGGKPPGPAP